MAHSQNMHDTVQPKQEVLALMTLAPQICKGKKLCSITKSALLLSYFHISSNLKVLGASFPHPIPSQMSATVTWSLAIARGMTGLHTAEYRICTLGIFSSRLFAHLKNRCGQVCNGWGREDVCVCGT